MFVTPGEALSCKFGVFEHADLVGAAFGARAEASAAQSSHRGHLYVLKPTPALWTRTLGHRTQIVYQRDISFIVLQLELRAGALVAEAGTGSGSLTCSLAAAVAPHGHVHTFEYHR